MAFVRCSPCCSYELSASSGVLGSDRVCPTLSRHWTPHPQASATVRNRPQPSTTIRAGARQTRWGLWHFLWDLWGKLKTEFGGLASCEVAKVWTSGLRGSRNPFASICVICESKICIFCTFLPGRPSVHLTRRVASFASRIGTDVQRSHKVQITVRGRRVLISVVFGEYYTVWNVISRFLTLIDSCDFRFPQWYGCPWLWVISWEVVHVSLARLSHKSVSQECFLRAQRSALLCPTRVSQKSSSKSILQEVDREHRTRVRKLLVVAISQEQKNMFQQHAWPSVTTAIQSIMYSRLVMSLGSITGSLDEWDIIRIIRLLSLAQNILSGPPGRPNHPTISLAGNQNLQSRQDQCLACPKNTTCLWRWTARLYDWNFDMRVLLSSRPSSD